MLCVSLLQIAEATDELLAGDVFVISEEVSLSGLAGVVDENVGVGSHSCHGTDHVALDVVSLLIKHCLESELSGMWMTYSFST